MTTPNSELVRRADLALSQLESGGGALLPEQAEQFIDLIQEQPTMLAQARIERMNGPKKRISRMGFENRILRAAPQGTPPYAADDGSNDRHLAAADRSRPSFSFIELNTKEVIAEVHVPYEALEDNIEGESMEDRLMRQIVERASVDLEEWVLQGDTASGDAYLALNDGLLKTAVSNVVDNTSAGISPDLFANGMLTMPQKYLRNLNLMRHFVTVAEDIRYRRYLAERMGGVGDRALTTQDSIDAMGVQIDPSPMMVASTGLFTYPLNMIFGIQRDISIETDKDIRGRQIIIVLTARVDTKWDDENAVVKYVNI